MGKLYERIDEPLREFIEGQRVFFVATAPSGSQGHVNVSPKGGDSLRVLAERTVAYLDFNGSGVETVAHLRDNGRITLMLCAFQGPPKIVRLHGSGVAVEPRDGRFAELHRYFPPSNNVRSIIVVEVTRISDSCGYSVPLYAFEGHRSTLEAWAEKKGPEKLAEYRQKKNATSIDGLAGLPSVTED
ncbi:MAG TPA: pyridoxamine 5'-phosphate oxidase family protein [Polyangiaceae bacterium]|jgi:hypothetical protein|nr:pyridoxamine 5'-phosphate oxidase family protein [Polyangiaceae bacterium]